MIDVQEIAPLRQKIKHPPLNSHKRWFHPFPHSKPSILVEMTLLNPSVAGLSCLRCGTGYVMGNMLDGCPACRQKGHAFIVKIIYDSTRDTAVRYTGNGMRRYKSFLPYESFPSLGEGGTPMSSWKASHDKWDLHGWASKWKVKTPRVRTKTV